MKNALQLAATAFAVVAALLIAPATSATIPASADPKEPVEASASFSVKAYQVSDSNRLRLFVQKVSPSVVWVEFKNGQGELLFQRALGKRALGRAFSIDLSELPVGYYTLEVGNRDKKVVQGLHVRSLAPAAR